MFKVVTLTKIKQVQKNSSNKDFYAFIQFCIVITFGYSEYKTLSVSFKAQLEDINRFDEHYVIKTDGVFIRSGKPSLHFTPKENIRLRSGITKIYTIRNFTFSADVSILFLIPIYICQRTRAVVVSVFLHAR